LVGGFDSALLRSTAGVKSGYSGFDSASAALNPIFRGTTSKLRGRPEPAK
jgi:hypothetical protein